MVGVKLCLGERLSESIVGGTVRGGAEVMLSLPGLTGVNTRRWARGEPNWREHTS